MVEEAAPVVSTPAPVAASAPAPSPSVSPQPTSVPIPPAVAAEAPSVASPLAADGAAIPEKPAEPVAEPAKAAESAAVAEAETPEAPKEGAEAKPEQPEPQAPAYAEFKMPEGFTAEPALISAYTNILGKYGISQDAGQELVEFHANAMREAQKAMDQSQRDVFADFNRKSVAEFNKWAGNRRDTILNDAKFAITQLVKDKTERAELWNVLAYTGAGNQKSVIRAFANMAKLMRERSAPPQGLPAKANGGSPADRRYGKTS